MPKVNELLSKRFKKASEKASKMQDLATRSTSGTLSSFSGVFRVTPLSGSEEEHLKELLDTYAGKDSDVTQDLKFLSAITSEVKAINNQAAILHGERIKRAQEILKSYRDGAFTSWLLTAYGNRQTPYNFLQYFEFYSNMPKSLQQKVDLMPRQAIYALATRNCDPTEKEKIVENYQGESKKELLEMIRERFPLSEKDKRAKNLPEQLLEKIEQLEAQFAHPRFKPSPSQKQKIEEALRTLLDKL